MLLSLNILTLFSVNEGLQKVWPHNWECGRVTVDPANRYGNTAACVDIEGEPNRL